MSNMHSLNQIKPSRSQAKWLASLLLTFTICAANTALASPGSELARREYDKGNFTVALQKLQPLADAGDAAAQNLLGTMYAAGNGVEQSDVQAAAWFWKAANGGNTEAQLTIADIYADGRGVTPDPKLADFWRWKAAEALQQDEKRKLQAEIVKAANPHVDIKNTPVTIHLDQCKVPPYKNTGYGYNLSGTMQILFLVGADGAVLESSLVQGTDWPVLDRAYLNSFAKTCTFTPAKIDGKANIAVYSLQSTWTVEP